MHFKSLTLKAYGKRRLTFNIFSLVFVILFTHTSFSAAEIKKIVALGDSLTAGYGLPQSDAFPVQLEAALAEKGHQIRIENAGVSGDTSTGGLQRLDWAIAGGADAVILELGANDALRGIEPSVTKQNLDEILKRLKEKSIPVFLTGMRAPPNMGIDYQTEFDGIFPELAEKHRVAFYPFFLDGVAAMPELNQEDAIHPNREGVALIVEKMLPSLIEFLNNPK
ncbi:arylesterase [Sneathiella sp. P13V-1]|uniref:arylesterase n=1 Tax=Sneathiella sp. P13V-1 TaxID=2697366 RepID=UPI00187B3619|nr:arylesterase [Sneathiella sp. P13V-1]MBE7636443.1 arylesterase [Sneathiella sp. P13V-1]